jgi:hypothetical protein
MRHKRAFDLGRAHPVAGDVDHVIDAAGDPVVAILVPAAAVAGEVIALVVREIGADEPLRIAPERPHLARPAVLHAQDTLGRGLVDFLTRLRVEQHRLHAEEGGRCRAGLELRRAGQRRDQVAAGLRLPPRVDDGATALADDLVVPVPGFRVDRFPDRAQQLQAGEIVFRHELVGLAHQQADRRGRGVELVDGVLFADLPEPARIG